ncbi:KH domain-containing protein [Niameybacter massiliensis]|uniref:RNA-binding protein KhpA n=1 Tax=Holtiella tumoricola TaxID=3018743 RepID=A0AA42J1H6_9FIRM|nr:MULTISPECIES: KH domain-containing protein [Lachnospirales]MDA3732542.1 KH domain-containing protein [Holtiella tumoricola]
MKSLVEVIAKQLVDLPEEVSVSQREEENAVILELKVAPSDMGKIIGKQGKIAKAIRTIVKSATASSSKKVVVEISE